ncbi:MAG: choice-of-anchor tandem repeat GloVer-containing protein [Capsulimonas sp.]|uniref:choice-of-anchor tandem repeat GloVer-containing protein n=1 Tax=Capsulimonas sp. TaxID=2494211 RepID=UPI00326566D3
MGKALFIDMKWQTKPIRAFGCVATLAALLMAAPPHPAQAHIDFTVLHNFLPGPPNSEGFNPSSQLVQASDGSLYGTTWEGVPQYNGAIFKITPSGVFQVLHRFGDGSLPFDGKYIGGLKLGGDGNLYGTTLQGGAFGSGMLFRMSPTGAITILHSFGDPSIPNDGRFPTGDLTPGAGGFIYGVTGGGGGPTPPSGLFPAGTVYRISLTGAGYTILHVFRDGSIINDGYGPAGGITVASDGSLYGTAATGGTYSNLDGTNYNHNFGAAYKISPSGAYTVLHRFGDDPYPGSASMPVSTLVEGGDHNFYGTAGGGPFPFWGTVYKMSPLGAVTLIHAFAGAPSDAIGSPATLVKSVDGSLYGTTGTAVIGGGESNPPSTIYQITPTGQYILRHLFLTSSPEGYDPRGGLIVGADGSFYGTTASGGAAGSGAVFKATIVPDPSISQISPSTVTATHVTFPLTVTGANFYPGAVVNWNGSPLQTTVVSSTQLTATVPASLVVSPGAASITVGYPDRLTQTSALTLTITAATAPTLTSITPSTIQAGHSSFTITGAGANFQPNTTLYWNGGALSTTVVSSTQVTATVPASLVATPGTADIAAGYADETTRTSALTMTITPASVPTLTGISPATVQAKDPSFLLTVTGTGYLAGVAIYWNGDPLPTTIVSGTTLTATVPASLVVSPGTANITVGYLSEPTQTPAQTLTITPIPTPTLTAISPSTVQVGHYGFTLTATGTNFDSGAIVYLNGSPLPTTVVSSTQLTAAVPLSALSAPGVASIKVSSPLEGDTAALPLTITERSTLTSLSPNTVQAGSSDFTFAVNGTGFVSGAQVVFNGAYITTHYVTPTQLTATVPRGYITTPAAASVTVINPNTIPDAPLPFTITGPAVPARCAPSTVQAGHTSFNLSIVGTGFTSSTKAFWNGTLLTTYFISSGQIVATVPAAFVAAPTTATITVTPTTPATTPISFPVTAAPVFTGMTPSTTTAGHADFTLTAIGTGFVVGAQITWNGTPLTTTYVSPTNLTATIPAALVMSAGTATLKVINPGVAPTGPRTFTITP